MEMALYGDAYVHLSAVPDVERELKGMSPLGALVRQQLYRELHAPTIPDCLAGPTHTASKPLPDPWASQRLADHLTASGVRPDDVVADSDVPDGTAYLIPREWRTPRPLVNEHDAAILRAAGAPEDTFDVSPDVSS